MNSYNTKPPIIFIIIMMLIIGALGYGMISIMQNIVHETATLLMNIFHEPESHRSFFQSFIWIGMAIEISKMNNKIS